MPGISGGEVDGLYPRLDGVREVKEGRHEGHNLQLGGQPFYSGQLGHEPKKNNIKVMISNMAGNRSTRDNLDMHLIIS